MALEFTKCPECKSTKVKFENTREVVAGLFGGTKEIPVIYMRGNCQICNKKWRVLSREERENRKILEAIGVLKLSTITTETDL